MVSAATRVEVFAAISRKHRTGELEPTEAQALIAEFEADYAGTEDEPPRFSAVAVTDDVLEAAAGLVFKY